MKRHLSPEEISRWIAGERDGAWSLHMSECGACAGEAERTRAALEEFRGAVNAWRVPPMRMKAARRRVPMAVRWVLAAAAAACLAALPPVYKHRQEAADAVLLEEVDAQVSQPVPRPMEPLLPLVSWNSNDGSIGEKQ